MGIMKQLMLEAMSDEPSCAEIRTKIDVLTEAMLAIDELIEHCEDDALRAAMKITTGYIEEQLAVLDSEHDDAYAQTEAGMREAYFHDQMAKDD